MLFQYGVGGFRNIMYYLQQWGVVDVFLPFIIVFTLIYAVLLKVGLFEQKNINVALAVAIGLLVVIPHIMGTYPPGADVVEIMNQSIPEIALLFIAIVMVLLMLGLAGKQDLTSGHWGTGLAIVGIGVILLIFLSAIFPFRWIARIDPALQSLIVILLVFGLIVFFVGRGDSPTTETAADAAARAAAAAGRRP